MEINGFDKVRGAVAMADTVEGRFVVVVPNTFSENFGSEEDLVGVRVPATSDEALRAKYIITWPVFNGQTPIYQPTPHYAWGMRSGAFEQAGNVPFSAKVYLTYPGYVDGETIPSGNLALAFTEGTFTLPSGCYVYSANIIKIGAALVVEYSGADAGKVKYNSSMAVGVIGFTESYDSTTGRLTVRVD